MEKSEIISTGLLEMYVIGAASPEEIIQVEKWRVQYPDINTELLNIEKAMEFYAMANAVTPSDSVKNKIFGLLDKPARPATEYPSKISSAKVFSLSPLQSMAAASIILLLSTLFYFNRYQDIKTKFEEEQQQLAQMSTHLTEMDKDMNIVQSKYSKPVSLDGLEAAPDAAAKIFWMKNTGEVYVDPVNMPMAPAGKQYQLWAIVDGKPVDGGMITSKDGKKYTIQKMKTFGKAEAFAITLETTGGHPQPKGEIYVMGKI